MEVALALERAQFAEPKASIMDSRFGSYGSTTETPFCYQMAVGSAVRVGLRSGDPITAFTACCAEMVLYRRADLRIAALGQKGGGTEMRLGARPSQSRHTSAASQRRQASMACARSETAVGQTAETVATSRRSAIVARLVAVMFRMDGWSTWRLMFKEYAKSSLHN